jgi:SAM-dependent methyltransferase
MKLSNLIAYQKSVNEYDLKSFRDLSTENLNTLVNKLKSLDINEDYQTIVDLRENIINSIGDLEIELSNYKEKILKHIKNSEIEYLRQSYDIYNGMRDDTPEYILDRENKLGIDNTKDFQDRINLYSSWKHPGLYIRPGKNQYIDYMTSCDPLYIADEQLDLLAPVKKLWNKEYQSRLRYKIISDDSEQIFRDLPKEQIGFVVATNFFDYKPFEVIKKYLIEIQQLLKPGGVVIFTYNNCDMPGSVRNVENMFNCYTPGRLLKDFIVGLDYELLYSFETPSGVNWLEIKKPGELTSMRGGQTLAKIIAQKADII